MLVGLFNDAFQTAQTTKRQMSERLVEMISKPTNAHNYMKVYYTHRIPATCLAHSYSGKCITKDR